MISHSQLTFLAMTCIQSRSPGNTIVPSVNQSWKLQESKHSSYTLHSRSGICYCSKVVRTYIEINGGHQYGGWIGEW